MPRALSPSELAPYEGRYTAEVIEFDGTVHELLVNLQGDQGQLHMTLTESETVRTFTSPGGVEFRLASYRDDFVLVLDATGQPNGSRSDFVRDAQGRVVWLRFHGRLYRHSRS